MSNDITKEVNLQNDIIAQMIEKAGLSAKVTATTGNVRYTHKTP